jgi:hypothetical protein
MKSDKLKEKNEAKKKNKSLINFCLIYIIAVSVVFGIRYTNIIKTRDAPDIRLIQKPNTGYPAGYLA